MDTFTDLDEDTADAMLSGPSWTAAGGLGALVDVLDALRVRRAVEPVPPMGAALRAQVESGQVVQLRARRKARRAMAIAAAAAAAAVVALGVGAAQNRLPAGVQDVVSSTAEVVGVHIHTSDERGQGHEKRSDSATDHARDGDGSPGYGGTTPGGAVPAVPNGPGEPATPAVPAEGNAPEGPVGGSVGDDGQGSSSGDPAPGDRIDVDPDSATVEPGDAVEEAETTTTVKDRPEPATTRPTAGGSANAKSAK